MVAQSSDENTYILDSESPSEMARLINLDRMATKAMGGIFSGLSDADLDGVQNVLDVACGPGGWVLDVAFEYPDIEVAGVDISRTMIDYANARARTQGLKNASFGVMNITQPLDFSAESFDLINARFLVAVLKRTAWDAFIAECTRLLRPGGILRLSEPIDQGVTTSPAFERMAALVLQAYWQSGYGFSVDGRSFGISSVLPRLLRTAGYQHVHYKSHAHEFSAETEAWADFCRNAEIGYHLVKPFLVKTGLTTQDEVDMLYQQMIDEMHTDDFCGMYHSLTVWGYKA